MSSRSIAEAPLAVPPATAATMRAVAMVPLLAYAVLTQLDAVANRISAGLPIGTTELILAALLGSTALLLLSPTPAASASGGNHTGARLIAAMFCWAVFSWTMSRHADAGLDYLQKLAIALLPAFCVLVIVNTPARLRWLLWAIIAAGAVSAAIVVAEWRTGTRIVSTSIAATTAGFEGVARSAGGSDQNPTTAAQMLLVSLLLASGWLFSGKRLWRVVLAGVMALGTFALVLASARSAIIGYAAGLGLIGLSFRHKPYFPLLVLAGIVAAIGALPFLPPTLIARFTAIGDFGLDPTLYRRITYLRIGADLIGQSPIWGVGPGNFPLYYVTDAYRWMPGREVYPRELHNTYLDAATEYGIVGFLLFAAALGYALLSAWRAAQSASPPLARIGMAVGVALAGLMVACFFMPHKDLRYLWLLVAIAIQCGRLARAQERIP
ncbi:O-antigen ligase [Sphingomonas sp. TZW2008]|uniref:O-antigen ligase family protein n=1 Tax=Sphingomonas sp. TZW2008 TaxID=1917973 RepID=UPI00118186CD|nr:O-antigen ligase family protein [Sphingomonas sp. TZW2008]